MPELRRYAHSLAGALNSRRIVLYALVSTAAVSAAVANSLKSYSNFYSVMVYLSKSSRSVMILANFGVLLAFMSGRVVQQIFFGPLRPNEIERLYDRLWFFVTESLLTFTIFRDEFDITFGLMFGFLLFVKSFHWLASDRIEWASMEQRPYPGPPPLFHIRMNALFLLLWGIDVIMFLIAVESTLSNGVGGKVLFASEYAILMASIGNTIAKYLLTTYELRRAGQRGGELAPPWEGKSMWIFYLELVTDFLKLTTYLLFFTVIVAFYGLPLSIVRDIYITARSFITRLRALHRYQNATRNMDQRYPSATEEDMPATSDRTCIICREEMVLQVPGATGQSEGPNTTPKKLPCGHIFHFYCLRSWLERQQSCPTCRRTVLDANRDTPVAARVAQPALIQPNGLANAGAQQQMGRNDPLGLVGRFLGAAGAPPVAPGQPAQGPDIHPANIGHPQEVIIQYRIQYGNPRQQPARTYAQGPPDLTELPLRELRPPPRLAGFQDPAGNYIPWGMDDELLIPNPRRAREQEVHTHPSVVASSSASPISGMQGVSGSPQLHSPKAPPSTDAQPTPREAAAKAALRRLSGSPITSQSAPSIASMEKVSDALLQSLPPLNESNESRHNDASVFKIPKLIPLYDRSELATTLQSVPTRSSSSISRPEPSLLASAPVTLGQASTLDQLSQDVIDERLQVLQGMSSTIQTCMDELTRLKTTLPPSSAARPRALTPARSSSYNETGQESVRIDQSGVQTEMPDAAMEATKQTDGSEDGD